MTTRWYDELRDDHRPASVRILLIGESPPVPADRDRRFFYSPILHTQDNLYRGVAEAVYGEEARFNLAAKPTVLRRLQADGYWLLDLSDEPVNHLAGPDRKRALKAAVPGLVERAVSAAPTVGAVICKAPLHRLLARPLGIAGVPVLHEDPVPFPMNWSRADFVEGFRQALGDADGSLPRGGQGVRGRP